MNGIFRIYTEDADRASLVATVGKHFENFTLQTATGYFKGRPEKTLVIEIVNAPEMDIHRLAEEIRRGNEQKSVLVMRLDGKAESIS